MLRTFVQVAALLLTLEAAFFLARSNLGLSAEMIARLASTNWNANTDIVSSLAGQRADTWIGVVLLLAAFFLQLANTLWPMRFKYFVVDRRGAFGALIVGAAIGVASLAVSAKMSSSTQNAVINILKTR